MRRQTRDMKVHLLDCSRRTSTAWDSEIDRLTPLIKLASNVSNRVWGACFCGIYLQSRLIKRASNGASQSISLSQVVLTLFTVHSGIASSTSTTITSSQFCARSSMKTYRWCCRAFRHICSATQWERRKCQYNMNNDVRESKLGERLTTGEVSARSFLNIPNLAQQVF